MLDHSKVPIYDALSKVRSNHISFHVPGHKDGHDFDHLALPDFRQILSIDQTEIEGLDDLHNPTGIIAEAEMLAADAFGSEETKFLVGGTTVGVLAVILGSMKPGDQLIIQRNSHKSIFNGLKMAKVEPVFLYPEIDINGLPMGVSTEQLRQTLEMYPRVKAVFLTSPNYYGRTSNLQEIAKIVHSYNIPLFVDEAHGAHFAFHHDLPLTALEQGADVVVQSIHKTLPAMTMASMLHFQGNRMKREQIKEWLTILQSSSPSYPLMASLDLARRHMMVGKGKEKLIRLLGEVKALRGRLATLPWLKVSETDDPLRLVMTMPNGVAAELQSHLQENGIYVEIVEPNRLVLVFTGGNLTSDLDRLWSILSSYEPPFREVPSEIESSKNDIPIIPKHLWHLPQINYDLFFGHGEGEWINLGDAEGRICAEMVVPYPPGVPFVLIGQKLTQEIIEVITKLLKYRSYIQGINHRQIKVFKKPDKE